MVKDANVPGSGKLDEISMLHMSVQNLVSAIETTNDRVEKTNDKVDKLTDMMAKQEVLFEKIVGLENNISQSFKHVHSRINEDHTTLMKLSEIMASGSCPGLLHIEEKRIMEKEKNTEDKIAFKDELKTIKTAIKDLQEKPAKRWDTMIGVLIASIVSAIVTAISVKIGLKQ
jgi:hypothetical protein